jgi:hypothetical protein
LEKFLEFEDLKEYRAKIESFADVPKRCRFEQIVNYKLDMELFDVRDYLPRHLTSFCGIFGMNEFLLDSVQVTHEHINQVQKMENNETTKEVVLECMRKFEANLRTRGNANLSVFKFLNEPIYSMEFIWVKDLVWPGILKPYLLIFESFLERLFEDFYVKDLNFLDTNRLELLGNMERVMQYLYSGDVAKLGKHRILKDTLLHESIVLLNFPRFHPDFYDLSLLKINLKKWPCEEESYKISLNCFSKEKIDLIFFGDVFTRIG